MCIMLVSYNSTQVCKHLGNWKIDFVIVLSDNESTKAIFHLPFLNLYNFAS